MPSGETHWPTPFDGGPQRSEIGRGSCRGRGEISGVAVFLKKKKRDVFSGIEIITIIPVNIFGHYFLELFLIFLSSSSSPPYGIAKETIKTARDILFALILVS